MNNSMGDEALNVPKRPIRLWLAGILNICIGGLSVALVVFLATSGRVPEQLQLSASAALLSSLAGAFLLFSSVVALMGRPSGRRLMYLGAFVFFGPLIVQNALALLSGSQTEVSTQKVVANVFRHAISLAFNVWALRSLVTQQFFASRTKV